MSNTDMTQGRHVTRPDPVIDAYLKHVDRTLIRENLKLTPEQRLRKLRALQRFCRGAEACRSSSGTGMTDCERLLEALSGAGVEFILVGGVAATVHGSARLTQDIDIVCARA